MHSSVLTKNSERTPKWDILKLFMIFFVVLGHTADFYTGDSQAMRNLFMLIYTVHMPVFIFVSGLFSKKTVTEKRFDKILGYLVLYFALKLLPFIYRFPEMKNPWIGLFTESGSPWFMFALFAFNLLTIALKDFSPKYILVFSIMLACFAGYDSSIGDFLALSRIIVFYPFFYMGYFTDRAKIETICRNKKIKAAAIAILIIFVAVVLIWGQEVYWLRPLLSGRSSFAALKYARKWGFLLRLGYYAVAVLASFSVIVLAPVKTRFGFLVKLGQRTLSVYAFHYVALYFIFERFDCKTLIAESLGKGGEWLVIPISVVITLFFSVGFFNKLLLLVMNIPMKEKQSISS